MKKNLLFLTASLLALGIASQASAADLRLYSKAPPMVAAIYDWSGLYIGINGGGGQTRSDWGKYGNGNSTGGTVGGQIGYRWQSANWVFGLEAQGNWADFGKTNAWNHVDGFGLFTGQIGYAWNNVLWYVKGGAAVVDNNYNWRCSTWTTSTCSADATKWGGTIGTGLEIGFAPNWSVGVEYDHLFLGDQDVSGTYTNWLRQTATSSRSVSQNVDMGLVRLNYKFGGPVVARY